MSLSHQIILKYFPDLSPDQIEKFSRLQALYEEWNSKINVISRKDMEHLYLHHILHSLAIAKLIHFKPGTKILDVGTGGGFPGIPLAILFPDAQFYLVDSIGKKITVVNAIKEALGLANVKAEKGRAEELGLQVDFVVSRAVTTLKDLYQWVHKLIRPGAKHVLANGLICLKGGDLELEINAAGQTVRVYELSDFFEEEFFKTKKAVYMPI